MTIMTITGKEGRARARGVVAAAGGQPVDCGLDKEIKDLVFWSQILWNKSKTLKEPEPACTIY